MRSRIGSVLAAVGSLTAIVIGIALLDNRVRNQILDVIHGKGLSPEMWSSVQRVQEGALVAVNAVRDKSIDHAPLTIFALAATVLLLFMLRT